MKEWFLGILLISSTAYAEVGQVTKIGSEGAFLMRGNKKIQVSQNLHLEQGDEIHSGTASTSIYLYPGSQLILAKGSVVKVTENVIEEAKGLVRVTSLVELAKGTVRVRVTKSDKQDIEQKVQTSVAVFVVRGTEFEVTLGQSETVELDVFEGMVEASSPLVQSFVPEYVKAKEGLSFSRKGRKFIRRKFAPRLKEQPGFKSDKEIGSIWKNLKSKRKKKS